MWNALAYEAKVEILRQKKFYNIGHRSVVSGRESRETDIVNVS
jgi:hypothetical protein